MHKYTWNFTIILSHFQSDQVGFSSQFVYSEWDHAFFAPLDGDEIIHAAYVSKYTSSCNVFSNSDFAHIYVGNVVDFDLKVAHHLEVQGFVDYTMIYIKQKFGMLPASEQTLFMMQHECGEEDVLGKIARHLFKRVWSLRIYFLFMITCLLVY